MTKFKLNFVATIILVAILTSCSSDSSTYKSSGNSSVSVPEKDPYEIMTVTFKGFPEIENIKPMLESVMETYNFAKTDDNRLKIANVLISLRKESAVGVTEMEILKHIYQHGSNKLTFPEQAGISATLLEIKK